MGPVPVNPLFHLSATIREQLLRSNYDENTLKKHPPGIISTVVKISGGAARGHRDVINWMLARCQSNITFSPDRLTLDATIPSRILMMTSIHILAVSCLQHEIRALLLRFSRRVMPVDEFSEILSLPKNAVLPDLRKQIIDTIIREYRAGNLQEPKVYLKLAKAHTTGNEDILSALEPLSQERVESHPERTESAEQIWANMDKEDLIGHPAGSECENQSSAPSQQSQLHRQQVQVSGASVETPASDIHSELMMDTYQTEFKRNEYRSKFNKPALEYEATQNASKRLYDAISQDTAHITGSPMNSALRSPIQPPASQLKSKRRQTQLRESQHRLRTRLEELRSRLPRYSSAPIKALDSSSNSEKLVTQTQGQSQSQAHRQELSNPAEPARSADDIFEGQSQKAKDQES